MFHIIYKGLIIGILVSIPIGPVGLLCIQRTLHQGQWCGFFSGIGIAFSDFLYAIITYTSMGIVVSFIEKNRLFLQILWIILLIAFNIYTFLNNPIKSLIKKEKRIKSYSQNILTVFLLAFSNPYVVLCYIWLFNSFHFLAEKSLYIASIGLCCIFMGNLLWWIIITYLAAKLHGIFNIQKLYIMNKIISVVIILLIISYSLGILR